MAANEFYLTDPMSPALAMLFVELFMNTIGTDYEYQESDDGTQVFCVELTAGEIETCKKIENKVLNNG